MIPNEKERKKSEEMLKKLNVIKPTLTEPYLIPTSRNVSLKHLEMLKSGEEAGGFTITGNLKLIRALQKHKKCENIFFMETRSFLGENGKFE